MTPSSSKPNLKKSEASPEVDTPIHETIKLKQAISKIKQLSGLLPICSYCSRIRDDNGVRNRLETYVKTHSEADFSHSICPECAEKHFPGVNVYD